MARTSAGDRRPLAACLRRHPPPAPLEMDKVRRARHGIRDKHPTCRVMSSAQFDTFTFMLSALMATLMLGLGVSLLFRVVVPPMIVRLFKVADAEKGYLEAAREGLVVRNRLRALQAESQQLESQRSRLNSEVQALKRQVAAAASRPPDFIHEIGEARIGQAKHVARVAATSGSPLLKPSSELYNPIWRHLNLAEIWAFTPDEAANQLDLFFPDKLGYQKHLLEGQPTRVLDRSR